MCSVSANHSKETCVTKNKALKETPVAEAICNVLEAAKNLYQIDKKTIDFFGSVEEYFQTDQEGYVLFCATRKLEELERGYNANNL